MKYVAGVLYKKNRLSRVYGPSVGNVRTEARWDVEETGEGSNTAITTQLISTGVTERISVTPSMFTQPGGGGILPLRMRKRDEGRKSDSSSRSIQSRAHYVHLIHVLMCILIHQRRSSSSSLNHSKISGLGYFSLKCRDASLASAVQP